MKVAPWPIVHVIAPIAATWKSGSGLYCLSAGVVAKIRPLDIHTRTNASWVRIAPRGALVVPEV